MIIEKKTVSISIEVPLFEAIENIAQNEKVSIQDICEKALHNFIEQSNSKGIREDVMEHLNTSIAKNYHLGQLLAK